MAERIFTEADIERIRALNSDLFTDTRPRTTVARLPSDLAARLPLPQSAPTVPARVYATDTPAHVDRDSTSIPFDAAHIVYLTPSPGELFIGDEVHSLDTPGQLFTIPAGTPHGTRGTDHSTRISIGPFNEAGRPVGFASGFFYYDVDRISTLLAEFYPLDTIYTIRSFTDVGGTVPSGQKFVGWTRFDTGTTVGYTTDDTVRLNQDISVLNLYPIFVTPPTNGGTTITAPSNAVLSTANAMVNESAETASVGGLALVRARRTDPAMRFPDHASYLRYQQGIARAQIRRAAAPRQSSTGPTVPSPPTNLIIDQSGSGGTYNNGQVVVYFSPPTNTGGAPILYYTVHAYTSVSGPDILYDIQRSILILPNPEYFIPIGPLSVNIPYTVRMSATNAVGTSAWSAYSEEFIIPGRPTPPQNVTATAGSGQVTVSYDPPANDGGFPVLYYTLQTIRVIDETPILPDISGNTLTLTKTGLAAGIEYNFTVSATNQNGNGPNSDPVFATTTVPVGTLIIDPTNLACYSGSGNTVTNIASGGVAGTKTSTVSWITDPSGAGQIFDFSGTGSYIEFPNFNFGPQVTVMAWIKPRSQESINALIANETSGNNSSLDGFKLGWNNWTTSDNHMIFEGKGGGASTGIGVITYTGWQQIVYVLDTSNNTVEFYHNATKYGGTPSIPAGINTNTNKGLIIGAFTDYSYNMNAYLGELRTYITAYSAAEVLALYDSTKGRYGL